MANFMPTDETKAQELTNRLSQTIFRSPEDFINFYNTGIINRKHADVTALVKEIVEVYRNVEERGGQLIFISKQEIYIDELLRTLSPWAVIVRVKRDVTQLLADETLSQDDAVVFSPEVRGFILHQTEDGKLEKVNSEKLYSSHDEIKKIHDLYSTLGESAKGDLLFRVSDFTELDDSFISEMHKLLP